MIFTKAQFREYARGLDERVSDIATYSDTQIDTRIMEGLVIAQDTKPLFSAYDTVDLSAAVAAGTIIHDITLSNEPHSVYDNNVICDRNYFSVDITADNHVICTVLPNAGTATSLTVSIRYFYYPDIDFTTLEVSHETYKFIKAAIAVAVYSNLSDEKNETLYMAKVTSIANTGTFDIEKELINTPETRLWQRTFV